MATSEEEIDRQHEEAEKLVKVDDSSFASSCTERCNHGEIPLSVKQCPTANLFVVSPSGVDDVESSHAIQKEDFFPSWSSRGQVDVSALAKIVSEGYNIYPATNKNLPAAAIQPKRQQRKRYTAADVKSRSNLWDIANAAVHNVAITRPSHDAWGINKIILVFCDDFLQQRYHLPWWHGANQPLRRAIQPILDVLKVNDARIVRLLFTSLPPAVTIPVHHDTGEWVKYTHRVHVPILVQDPALILFRCGLTIDSLQRIDCTPGHVFEINNQAKHTVSNCSTDHRVHLILDYVDADFVWKSPSPVLLEPAEVVLQTRRSVDRLKDRGHRQTPTFMILGAQKAGTTTLYEYIVQHPLVVRPRRRETHCLDWRWHDKCQTTAQHRAWCLKFYHHDQLVLHPSCVTGDSTPSYLLDSRRVIPRLKLVFEHPIRFLVILREPVQRAESQFAMVTSTQGTEAQLKTRGIEWRNKTVEQVVDEELVALVDCGLLPHYNMERKSFDQSIFDQFAGSAQEDEAWQTYLARHVPLHTGSYGLLARGMYELQLRPWLRAFDESQFLVLRMESSFQDGSDTMQRVWKHLDLPAVTLEDATAKNCRDYNSLISTELERFLHAFYAPYNQRLSDMLCKHGWGTESWTYNGSN
jgi:hypothetical protein